MSMLSAQIDELRNAAEFYDGFKAANLMRDAADTIWQLRDDLQRANAENAKLRELARKLYGDCTGGHYVVSCEGCEHAYEDYGGYVPLDPDYCVFNFSDRYVGCWKQKRLEAEMRELGVEVDG